MLIINIQIKILLLLNNLLFTSATLYTLRRRALRTLWARCPSGLAELGRALYNTVTFLFLPISDNT